MYIYKNRGRDRLWQKMITIVSKRVSIRPMTWTRELYVRKYEHSKQVLKYPVVFNHSIVL